MKKPFCDSCGQEIVKVPILETPERCGIPYFDEESRHYQVVLNVSVNWEHYYKGRAVQGPTSNAPELCCACANKLLQQLIEYNQR